MTAPGFDARGLFASRGGRVSFETPAPGWPPVMVAGATNDAPAAAEAEELEVVEVGELAAVVRVSVATSCIANNLAQPPLGLTQAQVAALVGVDRSMVSRREAEQEAVTVSNVSAHNPNTPIDNRGDVSVRSASIAHV